MSEYKEFPADDRFKFRIKVLCKNGKDLNPYKLFAHCVKKKCPNYSYILEKYNKPITSKNFKKRKQYLISPYEKQ